MELTLQWRLNHLNSMESTTSKFQKAILLRALVLQSSKKNVFRIENPDDVSDISLETVDYALFVNDSPYQQGASVTVGSDVEVLFESIADLTGKL